LDVRVLLANAEVAGIPRCRQGSRPWIGLWCAIMDNNQSQLYTCKRHSFGVLHKQIRVLTGCWAAWTKYGQPA